MASAAFGSDFHFVFFIQVFMKFCWFSLSLSRSVNTQIYPFLAFIQILTGIPNPLSRYMYKTLNLICLSRPNANAA